MDWISVVVTLIGSILISSYRIQGFYFWIAANATWIVWAVAQKPMILSVVSLNLAYFVINVFGIYKWSHRIPVKQEEPGA